MDHHGRGARRQLEQPQTLLRPLLDAHLIQAVRDDQTLECLALLGMRAVAGHSAVDTATRSLLSVRAQLRQHELSPVALRYLT